MSTGNVIVAGNVSGGPMGNRNFGPATIMIPAAVDVTQVIGLSIGNNTVPVPAGSTVAIIAGPNAVSPVPNPSYGGILILKGVASDTGVQMSAKWPTVLSWDVGSAPASIVINATVVCTVGVWCA